MDTQRILTDKQYNRVKNIKNPSVGKIIQLAEELNIDIKILAKYFINKISKEIELEKNK